MQKHFRILAIGLVSVSIAATSLAQESTTPGPETVVATVNGQDITLGHMIAARATLDERYSQIPAQQLYDGILTQLIQQTALAQPRPAKHVPWASQAVWSRRSSA